MSIAAHAIPSIGDSEAIANAVKAPEVGRPTKSIAFPIRLIIELGVIGKFIWLDLVYGVFVAMLLPNSVIWLLG